jgi:hypothetical protein
MENTRDVILKPCNIFILCRTCALKLNQYPTCRAKIEDFINLQEYLTNENEIPKASYTST